MSFILPFPGIKISRSSLYRQDLKTLFVHCFIVCLEDPRCQPVAVSGHRFLGSWKKICGWMGRIAREITSQDKEVSDPGSTLILESKFLKGGTHPPLCQDLLRKTSSAAQQVVSCRKLQMWHTVEFTYVVRLHPRWARRLWQKQVWLSPLKAEGRHTSHIIIFRLTVKTKLCGIHVSSSVVFLHFLPWKVWGFIFVLFFCFGFSRQCFSV